MTVKIISRNRDHLNSKQEFAYICDNIDGDVHDAIADVGLSPDVLTVDDLKAMNKDLSYLLWLTQIKLNQK